MTLVNTIVTWFMKKRMDQIELFMNHPHDVQDEVFRTLISSARSTEWGKLYHYDSIFNQQQFKERVPLQNYDSLKPYIERMMLGEQNILWSTEVKCTR